MNGARLLVKTLEKNGVKYIFGVPGDIENDFFRELKNSSIKFFNVRHEQAGAFMADVYYRLTGKVGVCFSTLGPGATNMLTGIANAIQDRAAVLALSGQQPFKKQYEDSHQYIDLVRLYDCVTKDSFTLKRAKDTAVDIQKAIFLALTDRPGPVHVSIPVDVLKQDAIGYRTIKNSQNFTVHHKIQLKKLYKLITSSRATVVIAGNGVVRANASKELLTFLKRYNIPVYSSFQGKGAVPADCSLYCGVLSRHSKKVRQVLGRQELIIAIGYDIIEGVEPDIWEGAKKVVHVDNSLPGGIKVYRPDLEVIGDTKEILKELVCKFKPVKMNSIDVDSMKIKLAPPKDIGKLYPLHPIKVIQEIERVLNKNDIVASDVGLHKQFVGLYLNSYNGNTVLFSNGLSSMGFSLPAGIVAKLIFPRRKVIVVCGDGGFQMNIQELATAVENNLSIICVVMNDGAYGMVKKKQLETVGVSYAAEFKKKFDFAQIAQAYGARGFKVNKKDNLRQILKKAISSKKVCVIDVPIQQYSDLEVMK